MSDIEKTIISSSKVVGTRQVLRSIASDKLRCVVLSDDADETLKSNIINAAADAGVELIRADSMEWLGKACGITVKAAVVGILKD